MFTCVHGFYALTTMSGKLFLKRQKMRRYIVDRIFLFITLAIVFHIDVSYLQESYFLFSPGWSIIGQGRNWDGSSDRY